MILAGDIGGTKTNLGLFEVADGALASARQQSYPSKDHSGLEDIVMKFMADDTRGVEAACFGVAGPVVDGHSVTPNLPWVVDSHSLARMLGLERVTLLNDLESTAHGLAELKPEEMVTLNEGGAGSGNAALVAAGTGLGVASLFWDGDSFQPSASEGGHMDLAPRDELEIGLLRFLLKEYRHVSIERVLSGPGLFNIYRFLSSVGHGEEDAAVSERMRREDPSKVIAEAAMAGESELCAKALDMFASFYGATAGNVALMLKATGGVFIGGGIAPKILEKLKDGTFMRAFLDKGRLTPLLETIRVQVVRNDKTALLGAARVAARSR
ncbi:MAG TPA: glucokinase [Blastocatellia bacterium]|nr:glucokinase [Blastocatellia bacterium]